MKKKNERLTEPERRMPFRPFLCLGEGKFREQSRRKRCKGEGAKYWMIEADIKKHGNILVMELYRGLSYFLCVRGCRIAADVFFMQKRRVL